MFLAHLTHEAVDKDGGVGAVLAGLITSRHYKSTVKRTVLVGPLTDADRKAIAAGRPDLNILSLKEMEDRTAAVGLIQIEKRYGVEIVYGTRRFAGGDAGVDNEAELLLIDVSKMPAERAKSARTNLQAEVGLAFDKCRLDAEADRYVRLAAPAYEALLTLRRGKDGPCVMLAHDWYGLPLAYWIVGRRDPRFRTVFYAHELAPVRPIIEKHPAHGVMFYSVMRAAAAQGRSLPDVFGPQDAAFRPALVMRTHLLNRLFAVGDASVDELRFLGPEFRTEQIDLVYNGVCAAKITPEAKLEAHQRLQEYARRLVGWRPNFVFAHVTHATVGKAFWRDVQVMQALDAKLAAAGEKAVLFIVASAAPARTAAEAVRMERAYGWPIKHRVGHPDLVGAETAIERFVRGFNRRAKASQAIYLNQVGWEHGPCGTKMPKTMLPTDIRRGTDVEFGMSVYEPFGASLLEPLAFGAVCVASQACGCRGFIERVDKKKELVTAIVKDYSGPASAASIGRLLKMTAVQAQKIEKRVAGELAAQLYPLLPRSEKDYRRYMALGYRYARQMSWENVTRDLFLAGVRAALG